MFLLSVRIWHVKVSLKLAVALAEQIHLLASTCIHMWQSLNLVSLNLTFQTKMEKFIPVWRNLV